MNPVKDGGKSESVYSGNSFVVNVKLHREFEIAIHFLWKKITAVDTSKMQALTNPNHWQAILKPVFQVP